MRLNMIPRDGGNTISGSLFAGFQDKSFQSDNLTDELKARGLRSTDGIDKLSNIEGVVRRPDQEGQDLVLRVGAHLPPRYAAGRRLRGHSRHGDADLGSAARHRAGRRPAEDQQLCRRVSPGRSARRTSWRSTTIACCKDRGAAMTAGLDPATASIVWNSPIYTTGSVKFTSTVSSKIFVEGGVLDQLRALQHASTSRASRRAPARPSGTRRSTSRTPRSARQWNAGDGAARACIPIASRSPARSSYVTGAHNVKVGVQDTWGRYRAFRSANGDLRAQFQNGAPFQAADPEHAGRFQDDLKADLGIYGQDSWTMNRLTLNYGARWEYFASGIPAETSRSAAASPPAANVRSDRHADLEELLAAVRRRLRPLRQPEDRGQVQPRQVHAGGHHRLLRSLQPAGADDADRGVDRR